MPMSPELKRLAAVNRLIYKLGEQIDALDDADRTWALARLRAEIEKRTPVLVDVVQYRDPRDNL